MVKLSQQEFHLCEPCNYDVCQVNPNYRKPIPFDEKCNCCKNNHNPNPPTKERKRDEV